MDFEFADNLTVNNIEKVPEQFRALYVKEGEAFRLKSDDPVAKGSIEAVLGLNKALKASRAEAKAKAALAVDLSPLSDFGKTPEEIAQAVKARLEELQASGSSKAKIDLEKIKADLAAGYAKQSEATKSQVVALTGQLNNVLVDQAVRSALGDQSVDPDLASRFVKDAVQMVPEDGQFKVFVVDKDGNRRYSGVTGLPMTIVELVKEMKGSDKFAPLFKSDAPKGSGSAPGGAAGKTFSAQSGRTLSATEKIAQGLAAAQRK